MLTQLQERFIFLGVPLSKDHVFRFSIPHEEFYLNTPGDGKIHAIRFRNQESPRRGALIYYHGNAGNLQRWGEITAPFAKMGFDVLVMDYRGYGKSKGPRNEELLLQDAWEFYRHAVDRLGYSEDQLVVYGRSLGGSFATYVASKGRPGKLVLETPFYNLWDVARHRFPFLPIEKIMKYKFASDQFIRQVECPITIYHGTRDRVVPHQSGHRLFRSAVSSDVSFYSIKGGRHHDLWRFPGYSRTIQGVLEGNEQQVDTTEQLVTHEH